MKERGRAAVAARVAIPSSKHSNRLLVGGARLAHALEQQRQQRVGMRRECVGLNGSEIVGRELPT